MLVGLPVPTVRDCAKDTKVSWVNGSQNLMLSFILGTVFRLFHYGSERKAKESKACKSLLIAECPRDMRVGKRLGLCGHQGRIFSVIKGFCFLIIVGLRLKFGLTCESVTLKKMGSYFKNHGKSLWLHTWCKHDPLTVCLPVDLVMCIRHQFLILTGQQVTFISKRVSKLNTGVFQQGNSI